MHKQVIKYCSYNLAGSSVRMHKEIIKISYCRKAKTNKKEVT